MLILKQKIQKEERLNCVKVKLCKGLEDWANESREEGRTEGRAEGRTEALASLVIDGVISKEEAASRAGMSLEEFEKFLNVIEA